MKNIFLIVSSSYIAINNKIKNICGDNANVTNFSLNDVTIYDVIDDASYFGLFNEERIIVVKDVKYFGGKFNYEEESNALYNYLQHMDEKVKIIFICDDIKKSKDLTKKVIGLGAEVIDLSTIDDNDVNTLIDEELMLDDINLDDPARKLLLTNANNNLDIVIQEIKKISNIDRHITEDAVKKYGSVEENIDNFEFSNAVISKNFNKCFELLDKMIASGVDAYSIVGLLASSYTNMYMVKDAVNHGLSDDEIAKKLKYSSTARVYVMKKNGKIYTLDELKNIIISLSDLDVKIKSGYNPLYEIKEFLLNL